MDTNRGRSPDFAAAFEKREALFDDPGTDCFRLFNGDRDGLDGLTVDIYGPYLLVQIFREELAGEGDSLARDALRALVPRRGIAGLLVKERLKAPDGSDPAMLSRSRVIEGDTPAEGFFVRQNGISAAVDLLSGLNTGVFLDMREVREALSGLYRPGDRMLNLFCYTALFSVHALTRGAAAALNVDLSGTVLQRARENYRLNGLSVDDRDFIQGDAFKWIKRLSRRGAHFDFVFFDPPTFSHNRRSSFSVRRDYAAGLAALATLVPGGHVLTAINTHTVSLHEYKSYHPDGWECLWIMRESRDFLPGRDSFLKAGLWKVKIS